MSTSGQSTQPPSLAGSYEVELLRMRVATLQSIVNLYRQHRGFIITSRRSSRRSIRWFDSSRQRNSVRAQPYSSSSSNNRAPPRSQSSTQHVFGRSRSQTVRPDSNARAAPDTSIAAPPHSKSPLVPPVLSSPVSAVPRAVPSVVSSSSL